MRILIADENHPTLHQTLINAGFECDLFFDKTASELQNLLPNYDGLVIRSKFKLTKEVLSTCPKLKCIGRVGAGMENIDTAFAAQKNIICVNAPEGNRDAVGEHALGMLLMLLNNLKKADAEVREGIWLRAENRGYEITGKTIGIIGFGHMGSNFAQKLSGFNCKILAYDKYKTHFGNEFVKESSLEEIFENADIVSLHIPLTSETEFMVNANFIHQFKKPIYIINTARGKCINTEDLVEALKQKKVTGACIDVLEYEAVSFENIDKSTLPEAFTYLIKAKNVILTPHIAGWTYESNYKMSLIVAEKMIKALKSLS
ncbi:MAG: NAD(P)-dependent oxidoreductase [Bacteroidota bacterium]|nr:NAD(P)-dependent oxidoreductase [Bacteroidota bacterium]